MIRIHKEGRVIVGITIALLLLIVILSAILLPYQVNYFTSFLSLIILVLVLRFFRVPQRNPFRDGKTITAPADGKVVVIEKVEESEYLRQKTIQVSIFMSIHNIHVNFHPVSGEICYMKYHPGKYLLARHPKSSTLNERSSVAYLTPHGSLLVRQIAGYVARRVCCYAEKGIQVKQGDELGFIKFGSRLDLFIPTDAEILVTPGQKVIGGITPVARFK